MISRSATMLAATVLALSGCATASVEGVATRLPTGVQTATIEMSDFTFSPNVLKLDAGSTVTITAVSKSRIPHNITVLSPDEGVLHGVDIGRSQTVAFQTDPAQAGALRLLLRRVLTPASIRNGGGVGGAVSHRRDLGFANHSISSQGLRAPDSKGTASPHHAPRRGDAEGRDAGVYHLLT